MVTESAILAKLRVWLRQPLWKLGICLWCAVVLALCWAGLQVFSSAEPQPRAWQIWQLQDPALQTAAQALQQPAERWQPYIHHQPIRQAAADGVWLKLALQPQADYLLHIAPSWLDELQFYQFDGQGQLLQQWQTGDSRPFASRPVLAANWLLPLASPCGDTSCQLLLYLRDPQPLHLTLSYQPQDLRWQQQQQLGLALLCGLLLFAALLAALLGLVTARAWYGWVTMLLLALLGLVLDRTGTGFQWLWPTNPGMNNWIALAVPILGFSSCGLLRGYLQLKEPGFTDKCLLTLQALAVVWGCALVWWLWLPAAGWQYQFSDSGGYLLLLTMMAAMLAGARQLRQQPSRTLVLLLPLAWLLVAAVCLRWPVSLATLPPLGLMPAALCATVAAMLLVSGLFTQLYLKKLSLSRVQQQLLHRNQQLAALQQQELLRSRIAPFYQLGSRLALMELLTAQLAQPQVKYRLLLIEFQQFDPLEAVLGRHKTSELLLPYLLELHTLCQQHSPAVVSLGAAPYQTLYALSPARLALLLQSDDFIAVFSKIRALLAQKLSLDSLAPDFKPRFASVAVDAALATDAEDLLAHGLLALSCVDQAQGYLSYQPQLAVQSRQRLALITELARAVALRQLHLYFQPVQDLSSQRIVALEALLRWQHPSHGAVSPAVFIPLAEETGLIHSLTRWVYLQVRQTQDLLLQQGQQLQIAFNLSGCDLEHHRLISSILKNEQQYPSGHKVKFELTESALQRDSVAASQSLALLHKSGALLVMDDFGAGQSMLTKLAALKVHEIKIDMALLKMLGTQREMVLAATIRLAKSMAMRVICEGVESQQQYDFLMLHNVDAVQGYFIARPMPLPQLRSWLANTGTVADRATASS
jgi:EAL domain-containing protein (putative c-di-GMP-specific phosphodiesterase class I)